jgi:hypothetical protein
MRRIKKIQDDIQSLFYQVKEKIDFNNVAECEVCGSLVFKKEENKGKPKIIKKETYIPFIGFTKTDKIHYTYYCKLHMPKSLKKEVKEK